MCYTALIKVGVPLKGCARGGSKTGNHRRKRDTDMQAGRQMGTERRTDKQTGKQTVKHEL